MEDISFCGTYCDLLYTQATSVSKDFSSSNCGQSNNVPSTQLSSSPCNCSGAVRSWTWRTPQLASSWRLYAAEKQPALSSAEGILEKQDPEEVTSRLSEHPAVASVEGGGVKESTVVDSGSTEDGVFKPTPLQIALAMAHIEKETGRDRIREMFKKDHMGHRSQEVDIIKSTSFQALILCFFVRFIPEYAEAKEQFIKENRATVFRTHLEAQRRQRDFCTLQAMREGCRFALKIWSFSTSFILISQMIACYRNKTSPLEYIAGGAVTGSILRFHMGLRGMTFGVVVGGVLGGLFGSVIVGLLKATGFTQEERHLMSIVALHEMEKSVIGEEAYQKKAREILGDSLVL